MLNSCRLQNRCLLMAAANQFRLPMEGQARPPFVSVTLSNAIAQLLAAKTAANRRGVYLKSLAHYLNRFSAGREQTSVSEISTANVEDWLKQFPLPASRQTWLNRISTLFAFSVRRDFIAVSPCTKIERVTVDRLPPKILSPVQSKLLLKVVSNVCRPYLILGMFAGIRPDELLALDWSQINLETKTVRVEKGKTRRRRIVPLHPLAVALLAACPLQRGPVSPSNVTVRRFKRAARAALGFKAWPKDVLRHTAASYLLALHGDVGKVAMMLGNSPAILMTHYHEPVNEADCLEFWNLQTSKPL